MVRTALLRRLHKLAIKNRVSFRFVPGHGKGSHGTLFYGDRRTTLKDLKKELGEGLLNDICKQLGCKDLGEALREASDCLEEALSCRMALKEHIPTPSKLSRKHYQVDVPLHLAPKVALYVAMRNQGVGNSHLARRLKCRENEVRRIMAAL